MKIPTYIRQKKLTKLWNEIVEASPVAIQDGDKFSLEILVLLTAKLRSSEELNSSERANLLKLQDCFSLNPAARNRMGIVSAGKNEFDDV